MPSSILLNDTKRCEAGKCVLKAKSLNTQAKYEKRLLVKIVKTYVKFDILFGWRKRGG